MDTYEVVYNACYGGFSVSEELCKEYEKITGKSIGCRDFDRHDKVLVELVKKMGDKANGVCAKLKVDSVYGKIYCIRDFDGMETVVEAGSEWIVIEGVD